MRVLDINTSNPHELSLLISTPDKKSQYRIKFVDNMFSGDDRTALFDALNGRESIWMELAFREVEGEVRSVHLLRTTAPPNISEVAEVDE